MSARKLLTGAGSVCAASGVRVMVQFFAVPVMARFLSPADYGLAGIATTIILLVMMIADSGLASSLVRVEQEDQVEWHTCFWLMLGIGVAAAMLLVVIAPVIGTLLGQPRLRHIIPALAAILPLQMLSSVSGASLQRRGKFQRTAVVELASIFISIEVGIGSAWLAMGVWALILQQVSYYLVRSIATLFASDYRPKLSFQLSKIGTHVEFGRAILLANLIGSSNRSIEAFSIGRVLGPEVFGTYTMAIQFARLPDLVITGPINSVLYPHIATIRGDPGAVASLFMLLTSVLALIFFPAVAVAAIASAPIFDVLLSSKWIDAGVVFQFLAPSIAIQCISSCINTINMALGRTDIQVRLASKLALIWLPMLFASLWFSIHVVALCYSASILILFVITLRESLPVIGCSWGAYMRCLTLPTVVASVDVAAYVGIESALGASAFICVGLAACITIVSLLTSLALRWQDLSEGFTSVGKVLQELAE